MNAIRKFRSPLRRIAKTEHIAAHQRGNSNPRIRLRGRGEKQDGSPDERSTADAEAHISRRSCGPGRIDERLVAVDLRWRAGARVVDTDGDRAIVLGFR